MMNQTCRRSAYLLLLLFLCALPARAQTDPLAGFSAWIQDGIDLWKTPGLAVAVVKDGDVAFEQGFGVKEYGKPDRVDVHTLFSNASTTKAFTAMAVAMLVNDGKIGWQDRVVDHVPEFRVADPARTMDLRTEDILSHRAGLEPTNTWGVGIERIEGIRRMKFAESNAPIRSTFEYNNDLFVLAGVLIERVSGMPWAEFLRTRILEPLGMSDTHAIGGDYASLPNRAMPHYLFEDQLVPTPYAGEVDEALTAGSMVSSVHDMTKWMTFLLDSTRVGKETLLAPETFSELFRMHMHIRDPLYPATAQANSNLFGYGFGWFLEDYRGHLLAMHTGSINGMVAIVALMPDQKLGVVVFGNRDHVELRHAIMYEVMDRYLGPTGKDWSRDLHDLFAGFEAKAEARKDSLDALRVMDTTPTLPLEAYTGTYRNRLYGDVIVELAGNSLRVRRPTDPHSTGNLVHWNYDVFKWENDIAPFGTADVEFNIDASRKLVGLKTGNGEYEKIEEN